jgi:enterochelin esterase-like enzyme
MLVVWLRRSIKTWYEGSEVSSYNRVYHTDSKRNSRGHVWNFRRQTLSMPHKQNKRMESMKEYQSSDLKKKKYKGIKRRRRRKAYDLYLFRDRGW